MPLVFSTLEKNERYWAISLLSPEATNQKILKEYQAALDAPETKKTHFFAGRYENIYLSLSALPSFVPLIQKITHTAAEILKTPSNELRVGFWINDMPPGHTTTLHSHDDDDELLSAVYYLKIPPASGNLVFKTKTNRTELTPVTGDLFFFDPALPHEVTENKSQESRLSIGMNIGMVISEDN